MTRGAKLVAIVGGSGSGKSWVAERLERLLAPDAARLSQDDFYRDRSHLAPARRAQLNFDNPRAIDWDKFEKALRKLRMGHPAQVPIYDFASHSRRGARWLDPRRILLVDGLWLLRRPKLRRLFDFAVFLDVSMSRRLYLRVKRDVSERGRSAASVREQFRCMVEPMHRKYVAPQARWADLVLARNCTVAQLARIAARIPNLKS